MSDDDLSPFQKVCLAITGGCGCACHTGMGMKSSCEHCYDPRGALQYIRTLSGDVIGAYYVRAANGSDG